MAAAWHRLKRNFQTIGHVLRARQWNIGIVITRPATAHAALSLANTSPIERRGEELVIQGVIVGKTECADEARGQKETVNGLGCSLDQSQSECGPQTMSNKDGRGQRQ